MRSTRGTARWLRALLPAILAVSCWGCRADGESRLVRLVDRAEREAIVESPLLDLAPVGELATRTVWGGRFAPEALDELSWSPRARWDDGLRVEEDSEEGRVICIRGGRPRRYPVLLRAEPLTRYRVHRTWRSDTPGLDLRVVESSVGLERAGVLNAEEDRQRLLRGKFLAKTSTPAVHRFAREAPVGAWDSAVVDFTTSLDTRTLVILFDRVDELSSSEACLAELVVETVEATPAQELALLAESWTRPTEAAEGDVDLGLVKRGSLLPVRRLRKTRPPYDENYEHRDALFAPAPTTLRFPVRVPEGGRLTFSYALARGSRIGDAAGFEVVVRSGGSPESVFAERIAIGPGGEGWHWRQAQVPLDAWEGRRVELELRTAVVEGAPSERAFALWGNPIVDAPRRAGDPPNVVLIGIDTLRADRLSSYGYEKPTSPHLDRLAAEGIRFDQAVSASNWTAPSFASIFTGLTVTRHGVVNQELAMSDAVTTLAERLRAGGWRTHAIAYKAYLFGLGLDQGFDRWFNLPTSRRTAQVNLDKAFAWLDRHHDRRFFLFFHLDDPHQPFNQPEPFDLRFGEAALHEEFGVDLPIAISRSGVDGCSHCFQSGRPRPRFLPVAQALYDGAVAYTDDRIGALLDRLREHGIYDDTVIAVISDHGEVIYDRHEAWGHGAVLLTDELVRVPMILKPARNRSFDAGQVVTQQVRATDLPPTLVEAAGLTMEPRPATETVDSRSLWPLIDGAETQDRIAFVENPERNAIGVRTPGWKYIVRSHEGGSALHQMFDLASDPGETVDLSNKHLEQKGRLGDLLADFLLRSRPGPFVLVMGDAAAGEYRLALETSEDVSFRSLVGLTPIPSQLRDGPDRSVAGGRVLALLEMDLRPGQVARATLRSGERTLVSRTFQPDGVIAWAEGTFERLSALPTPEIYFLRGAPPVGAAREAATTNVDQLEDLRALGYIE